MLKYSRKITTKVYKDKEFRVNAIAGCPAGLFRAPEYKLEKFLTASTKFARRRELRRERRERKRDAGGMNAGGREARAAAMRPGALRREEFIRIRGGDAATRLVHRVASHRRRSVGN